MKLADLKPVSKKENTSFLKSYRSVSVLLVVSKIYKRYAEADF